ncbi:SPOSA6832_01856, partial [Sporobolomyces salmonicolor]
MPFRLRVPRSALSAAAAPSARSVRPILATPSFPSSALRQLHLSAPRLRPTTASQSVYSTGSSCPACHTPLPASLTPVCPSCAALLPPPPPSTTYFDLFALPPSYAIEPKKLKLAFLKMQQKVHPDMFSGQGDKESWAKAWSGRVNDAYKILVNDRERGEYLLSLHDVIIGEADPVTEPELLMEVLETREALEEASTEDEVAAIRQANSDAMKESVAGLSTAFSSSPPDLDTARNLVIRLKYLDNVETVCREWSPGKRIELQH